MHPWPWRARVGNETPVTPLTLFSFAKINPVLRVLRKRPDGFHDIETILQTVDLTDSLTFTPATSGVHLTCTEPSVPVDHRNLAHKAVALVQSRYGCKQGIKIHIEKRIPVAAGLAGGSGNAAVTLHALNRMWALHLGEGELLSLAAELGSDTPFCLYGGTASGQGRGEQLSWLDVVSSGHFVLVNPPCTVSAAWAYQNLKLGLTNAMSRINLDVSALQAGCLDHWLSRWHNDLEAPVQVEYPMVDQARRLLKTVGAIRVLMSGSGPTVFGFYSERTKAVQAANTVRQQLGIGWRVYVVSPVSRRDIAERQGFLVR